MSFQYMTIEACFGAMCIVVENMREQIKFKSKSLFAFSFMLMPLRK